MGSIFFRASTSSGVVDPWLVRCFVRQDLRWIWFSLKFDAVALAVLAVVFALMNRWLDFGDIWVVVLAVFVGA